jgi:hypothetical protein
MPVLQIDDISSALLEQIRELAAAHNRTMAAEAVRLIHCGLAADLLGKSQAELLGELRRRRFTPPAGTPDSVELLREDRGR